MPHCRLLNTLAKSRVPQIRHSLSTPRAAGWGSSDVLEAGSIVNKVAYSPDGLLVFSSMDNGRLRVWSTVDFEEVAQLAGHKDEIWTLAISPNGLRLASGSCDCTVRIWDGRTFEELGVCEHRARVNWVAFSPDNNRVASASNDGTATIWNAFTFELVSRLAGHTQAVTVIYFFPDNTQIVSGSLDCTLRFWDAKTYEPLSTLSCSGPVWMLVVSPDSARLAWNEFTSRETGVLHMLEIVSQTEQAQMKLSQRIYPPMALDFSPDGALFATGTESGAVHIWNANDMSIVSTFKGHQAGVTSIAFSPDGLTLASGSHDSTVRISLTAPCEDQHATIPGHDSFVYQVAFSPDGSRLVSCSADHTVRIWDSTTCQELAVLTGHDDYVWAVAFSPDGSRVISGSSDRTIRVWDALIFSKVAIITGHQHDVNCVVFSPDGALIASCSDDRTVRLWDSSTHQRITRLEGHSLRVWSVAFSPAGTRLVSTSQDKTIRVWDAVGFAQLAVFDSEAHQQGLILVSAMFSLNSKAVLVRGEFGDGLAWVSEGEQDCKCCLSGEYPSLLICDFSALDRSYVVHCQKCTPRTRSPRALEQWVAEVHNRSRHLLDLATC
jgi:WD40 repeat protein